MIGSGAISELGPAAAGAFPGGKAAVITDTGVPREHVLACRAALESAGLGVFVCSIPAGESGKTLSAVSDIYGFLLENGFTRADGIVGLGGGMVGDTAGFAAATYMRGTAFVSVPTTIVSQTDSAYGGKTGVDLGCAKNAVGVFSHPAAVVCDTEFLKTLPERERVCGMGEVIKYGAIASPELLGGVSRELPCDETVFTCAEIKRRFVEEDELDLGSRRALNFGHTLGHAFEAASGFTLGQAVAYGMLAVTRLGERLGVTQSGVYGAIRSACERAGLDTSWEGLLSSALPLTSHDKKSDGSFIETVLLESIGRPIRKKLPPGFIADERNYKSS